MTLKELRASKGWSMDTLSKKAGVSVGSIRKTERGETVPRPSIYKRLCKALGVTRIDSEVRK